MQNNRKLPTPVKSPPRYIVLAPLAFFVLLFISGTACERETAPTPVPGPLSTPSAASSPDPAPPPVSAQKPSPSPATPAPAAPKPVMVLPAGMNVDARFHDTHTKKLNLKCDYCHSPTSGTYSDPLSQVSNEADRRTCLGCHKEGSAQPFFGNEWQKSRVGK